MDQLQQGVKALLRSLEEQMEFDLQKEIKPWNPRALGFTIFQTYVDAPDIKTGIWNVDESVKRHYSASKIYVLLPKRFPTSHSGWQFFMSGAGDITNPHIDPPITRSIIWQVIGYKLWCIWPATSENLVLFQQSVDEDRTWEWAMTTFSKSGRTLFIMEPGTWCELKQSEIHACISLSPSVHAAQEFFSVDDAEAILRVWKDTETGRKNTTTVEAIEPNHIPAALSSWLPSEFNRPEEQLDPMVRNAISVYEYGLEMVREGKSDTVTLIPELCDMLSLVRLWICKNYRDSFVGLEDPGLYSSEY